MAEPTAISSVMTVYASIPQDTTERADLRRIRGSLLQEYVARFIQPMDLSSMEAAAATMVKLRGGATGGFMPMLGEVRFTRERGRPHRPRVSQALRPRMPGWIRRC